MVTSLNKKALITQGYFLKLFKLITLYHLKWFLLLESLFIFVNNLH